MKKYFAIFFLPVWALILPAAYGNYLQLDLNQKQVRVVDFSLGEYLFSGDFNYGIDQESGSFFIDAKGEGIIFAGHALSKLSLRATRQGSFIFINRIKTDNLFGQGNFNLENNQFRLDLKGNWWEDSDLFRGEVDLKVSLWGEPKNFLASGDFVISDGNYEDFFFERVRGNFLGSPPVFSLTNLEVILPKIGSFELAGAFDVREPKNFFPSAEVISQNLFFYGWQALPGQFELGLRRQLDERFDIMFDAEREDRTAAELRYNLQKDNYLKLRVEKDDTILGVERRREF